MLVRRILLASLLTRQGYYAVPPAGRQEMAIESGSRREGGGVTAAEERVEKRRLLIRESVIGLEGYVAGTRRKEDYDDMAASTGWCIDSLIHSLALGPTRPSSVRTADAPVEGMEYEAGASDGWASQKTTTSAIETGMGPFCI